MVFLGGNTNCAALKQYIIARQCSRRLMIPYKTCRHDRLGSSFHALGASASRHAFDVNTTTRVSTVLVGHSSQAFTRNIFRRMWEHLWLDWSENTFALMNNYTAPTIRFFIWESIWPLISHCCPDFPSHPLLSHLKNLNDKSMNQTRKIFEFVSMFVLATGVHYSSKLTSPLRT